MNVTVFGTCYVGLASGEYLSELGHEAVIVSDGYGQSRALGAHDMRALGKAESVLYHLKYVLPRDAADRRL